MTSCRT